MVANQRAAAIGDLLNRLLDKGYDSATRQVLGAIVSQSTGGVMAQRLSELEAEAQRLADEGKKLTTDNPVYRAAIADLTNTLRRQSGLIDAAAPQTVASGANAGQEIARQLTLPFTDTQLKAIGVSWNRADPDAINALLGYVNSEGWQDALSAFSSDIVDAINNAVIRGVVGGQGPLATARLVRQLAEGLPAAKANMLLRTAQLSAYRDATQLSYLANADILEPEAIRVETFDGRQCLMCVALHGTRVPIGTRILEHPQGRGTTVAVVKGRPRNVRTGEQWFNELSESEQQERMGVAAYAAYKDGAIKLSDYVQPYTDKIFGPSAREASLKGMLGEQAKRYYQRQVEPS